MTKTITVSSMTGRDGSGDPSYGANRTVKAMQEDWVGVVRNIRGEDIMVSTMIASHDEIKYNDRIWLDGENPATESPKVPQVIKSGTYTDGTKLYEVKL